jgi:AbrB family looped-hinge helix DNA binding protein
MPTATLTSKGQLTLPRRVRDHLRVQAGDTVDFVIDADGSVHVRAGDVDVSDLKGLLRQSGRRAVSLEEMDAAVRRAQRLRR